MGVGIRRVVGRYRRVGVCGLVRAGCELYRVFCAWLGRGGGLIH